MSRSLRVQVKLFTRKNLERFGLSLLETEVNHNKMMGQKIEVKRFGSSGSFAPAASFSQFLTGLKPGKTRQQLPEIEWGSNILTDKQSAALESLGMATRILGHKAQVKSLPSVGGAIPVEFHIPPREREKIPVRPIRPIAGKYET